MSGIIKWSPFLESMDDMDKMFGDFPSVARGNNTGHVPAIDMYEEKEDVIVEAQLAGIDPDKVSISIENDVLCIKGESEKKTEVDDKNYYKKEIRRGSFFRSVSLPAHVDGDRAKAVAEDGVLKITVPKKGNDGVRTIKIENKKK